MIMNSTNYYSCPHREIKDKLILESYLDDVRLEEKGITIE